MTAATTETTSKGSAPRAGTPPGPRELPFLGSTVPMVLRPLEFLVELRERYGDVVYFRLPGLRIFLLNHPSGVEEACREHSDVVIKDDFTRKINLVVGNGLLTSEGAFWKRQRRLAQPAFRHDRIHEYGAAMVRRTEQALEAYPNREVRDVHADLMRLTLDIVAETLFGIEVKGVAESMGEALEVLTRRFGGIGTLIPMAIPTPENVRARRAIRNIDSVVYGIIRDRRQKPDSGDLLSTLLSAQEEGGGMTDLQLRDEVVTLLLAGHETTALALSHALNLIARDSAVEDALAAECARVLGGRSPTVADLPLLTYADGVIKETLRLYPPAWAIGREATAPIRVAGYDVAPGTQLWAAQWVVHRDPRFFDDPERFHPERWQGDLAKRLPRFAYFPFGAGPRVCIGQGFAMMEAVLLLVTFVQRFRVRPADSRPIELSPSVTLRPKHGVRLELTRR